MGGSEQLARLAGGLAGLGIAIAAAFPFDGVPPHGVSGRPVPAQVEVRTLASGVFTIDPLGTILQPTAFPAPGAHGGPSVSVVVTNISPLPLELSVRLIGLAPALNDAATVRVSGGGAVLANGPLGQAASWSVPAGLVPSGGKTTVRLRFKLKPGISPDAYGGHLDIRQLELQGTPAASAAPASTPAASTPPSTAGSTTPSASVEPTTAPPTVMPKATVVPTTPSGAGH